MPATRLLLCGLLLIAATSCRRGNDEPALDSDPVAAPIRIEVQNNHVLPVEIFVDGSGIHHRLGTVHPGMKATFQLPPALIGNGSVEFVAQSSANPTPNRTGPILLSPGAVVDYVVGQVLFNSTATIRP
jgi:hypothetical protein